MKFNAFPRTRIQMRVMSLVFMAFGILLLLPSCHKTPYDKVQYILELDAAEWLREKASDPNDSMLNVVLNKVNQKPGQGRPIDLFEHATRDLGADQRMFRMFYKNTGKRSTFQAVIQWLDEQFEADVQQTYRILNERCKEPLFRDPQITIDSNQRLILKVEQRPGFEKNAHQMLRANGKLEFFETHSLGKVLPFLKTIQMHEQAADSSFDLFKLVLLQEETFDERNLSWFPAAQVALADTAKVNHLLASSYARGEVPYVMRFAWTYEHVEMPDHPQAQPMLELYFIKVPRSGIGVLDGSFITKAYADETVDGHPCVSLEMNAEGATEWAEITKQNLNRQIVMVFDGYVRSAPRVLGVINGGRTQISGNFTKEEAQDLSAILNAGQYPARLRILNETLLEPAKK